MWEGSGGQESWVSTAMPVLQAPRCLHRLAQSSPCLPQKGVPGFVGPGLCLHWAASPCITSAPVRAPPGLPSPAGTWRDPCG